MVGLIAKKIVKSDDYSDPKVRAKYGMVAGVAGIVLNVLLSGAKIAVGLLFGLISLVADGANNLSDAASSIVTVIGFRLSAKKQDAEHPFGHGRIEYLAGLIVAVVILFVAIELARSAIEKLLNPSAESVGFAVLITLVLSILVKFYMFAYNRSLGNKLGSATLKATATDSLSDCIATAVVLISALVFVVSGVSIDGYAGLAVSIFVGIAGIRAFLETVNPLLGQAPDPQLVKNIEKFVLNFHGVSGVHDLIVHDYGPGRRIVSFHAELSDEMTAHQMHDIADAVEEAMSKEFGILTVVHTDPVTIGDEVVDAAKQAVREQVKSIDPTLDIHDFRMVKGEKNNLIFDLAVPYDAKLDEKELEAIVVQKVIALSDTYIPHVKVERSFSTVDASDDTEKH